jgi:pimeloyl-ACP methyl ester carboxylesterase
MGGIPAGETFDGTFPFAPHFSDAGGFRMHYVDEGSGDPIILIHGEPTWSYLYRKFIPVLSRHFRVIAPDHMGFGKSESPAGAVYTRTSGILEPLQFASRFQREDGVHEAFEGLGAWPRTLQR